MRPGWHRVVSAFAWTVLCAPVFSVPLRITFVDVEGGQATLIVAPTGESLLVDAGWPQPPGRDSSRIARAARELGIKQLDFLLVTHYHLDHVGGVPPLVTSLPVVTFLDHGDNTETGEQAEALARPYYALRAKARHRVVKPGDELALGPAKLVILSARGRTLEQPLPGAGQPNPACASATHKPEDTSENGKSVGFLLQYGRFRFLDLADLTWNFERALACPENKIGTVDVYLSTHHLLAASNNPVLVHAVRPRVAILNNGARKGGDPEAWRVIRTSPGLEDIWQLHYALKAGPEANAPEAFVANPEADCQGYAIQLEAEADGSFSVTNSRNGFRRTYPPRQP